MKIPNAGKEVEIVDLSDISGKYRMVKPLWKIVLHFLIK